jgi:hypothetical protein
MIKKFIFFLSLFCSSLSLFEGLYYVIRYLIKSHEYPGIPVESTIKMLNQLQPEEKLIFFCLAFTRTDLFTPPVRKDLLLKDNQSKKDNLN